MKGSDKKQRHSTRARVRNCLLCLCTFGIKLFTVLEHIFEMALYAHTRLENCLQCPCTLEKNTEYIKYHTHVKWLQFMYFSPRHSPAVFYVQPNHVHTDCLLPLDAAQVFISFCIFASISVFPFTNNHFCQIGALLLTLVYKRHVCIVWNTNSR